jgi:hypothetical protein
LLSFDEGPARAIEWVVFERVDALLVEAIDSPNPRRPDRETQRQGDLGLKSH